MLVLFLQAARAECVGWHRAQPQPSPGSRGRCRSPRGPRRAVPGEHRDTPADWRPEVPLEPLILLGTGRGAREEWPGNGLSRTPSRETASPAESSSERPCARPGLTRGRRVPLPSSGPGAARAAARPRHCEPDGARLQVTRAGSQGQRGTVLTSGEEDEEWVDLGWEASAVRVSPGTQLLSVSPLPTSLASSQAYSPQATGPGHAPVQEDGDTLTAPPREPQRPSLASHWHTFLNRTEAFPGRGLDPFSRSGLSVGGQPQRDHSGDPKLSQVPLVDTTLASTGLGVHLPFLCPKMCPGPTSTRGK